MEFERLNHNVILSIPEKTLLLLTFNKHTWNSGSWERTPCTGVGIIKTYNIESIKFNMLALNYEEMEQRFHDALRFNNILKWEPFPVTDLPLLMGWETTTPFLAEYLKRLWPRNKKNPRKKNLFAPSVVVKSNSPAPPTPAPTVTGGNTPQVKGTYIMPINNYEVEVCRIGYATASLTIRAKSFRGAEKKALEEAGNVCFSEHNSEYVLAYGPTKEFILQQKLNEANKHLDLILETLKFDLPLLLGLDKNLDKKINRILRTK